ncbi:MAG: type IV conjugative transfer system coupling protein TraD [Proteobacteria bacterium]|nr:type IV conjugative transfer system coupling protein TraD [Pseudomonadota bacterium]
MKLFSDAFTQGGQTQLHQFRMIKQVVDATFKVSFWVFLVLFVLLILKTHIWQDFWMLLAYGKAYLRVEFMSFLPNGFFDTSYIYYDDGTGDWFSDQNLLNHTKITNFVWVCLFSFLKKFFQSLMITFVAMIGVCYFWYSRGKQKQSLKILSGFELVDPKRLSKLVKKQGASVYKIGEVPLPKDAEFQHMMVTGTTGSGKSNMIHHLLNQIREQGDQAIIVDTTGGMVSRFYDGSRDLILNPLDERSQKWNMWKECTEKSDFDELAETLLESNTPDQFWVEAGRQLFAETAYLFSKENNGSLKALLKTLLQDPLKNIQSILQKTNVASLMDPSIEKTALSVRVTMMTHLRSFLNIEDGGTFSINQWMQSPEFHQFLFLSCKPDQRELLKPLITAWVGVAIKALMKQSEDNGRRVWFIIDELASLQKIPSLMTALTEIRKYGGCIVLGIQNLPLIENTYDRTMVKALSDLTGTKVVFRSLDPDVTRTVSSFLGEQEVMEASESVSYGAHQMRDGVNLGAQKTTRKVVPPTEIMKLQDLNCFIKLKGDLPVAKYAFTYLKMEQKAPSFIPKSKNREDDFVFSIPVTKEDLLKDMDDATVVEMKSKQQEEKVSMEEIVKELKESNV